MFKRMAWKSDVCLACLNVSRQSGAYSSVACVACVGTRVKNSFGRCFHSFGLCGSLCLDVPTGDVRIGRI